MPEEPSPQSVLGTELRKVTCNYPILTLVVTCPCRVVPACQLLLLPPTNTGDRCASCNGACLVSEKKTFEVQVEQGMKHGQKIVLRGEAGCTEPGLTPGDVVLVVQQKQHDVFKRIQQANPADLLLEKTISLKEALCGCSFEVQHLDGRTLHIKTKEGQVIKPNSFLSVAEEGMPVHGRPFVKGNLYIRFEVGVACLSLQQAYGSTADPNIAAQSVSPPYRHSLLVQWRPRANSGALFVCWPRFIVLPPCVPCCSLP